KDCRSFGWNLKELEAFDPPLITIVDGFSSRVGLTSNERFQIRANVDSLLITLLEVLDVTGATRVVIDSLTTLTTTVRSQPQLRKEILTMSAILGNRECTTLLTAEYRRQGSDSIVYAGSFSPEEYSTQGAIVVNYHEQRDGSYKRSVLIQKMRGHRHEFARKEFEITENGVLVHPDKNVGSDG
ncbi:MAG: ATPase domain-containing protein, partial [Promethearchaeota archaeon]